MNQSVSDCSFPLSNLFLLSPAIGLVGQTHPIYEVLCQLIFSTTQTTQWPK